MTIPAFLDNALDHHLEAYEKELDETVRLSTQNSYQVIEHLFICPVLPFVMYLLHRILKMKAGRNRLGRGGALPSIRMDMKRSIHDATYMETVLLAEFKGHPDDVDFFPDFAKMDTPENLGETLIEALSNSGIPGTDAIGTSVEEATGLQTSPVLKQFKQENMEDKDLLKDMESASAYREVFLTRKMTGARRQTYIDESLYKTLTGVLPVIAPGVSVPTFMNNVLAEHMEKYRDIINETCHRGFKEMMAWKGPSVYR